MGKIYFYSFIGQGSRVECSKEESIRIIRYMENAGVDILWDGGCLRSSVYNYISKVFKGLDKVGEVPYLPSLVRDLYKVVDKLKLDKNIYIDEYVFISQHTNREVNIPMVGGYTITSTVSIDHYVNRWLDIIGVKELEYISAFRDALSDLIDGYIEIVGELKSEGLKHVVIIDVCPLPFIDLYIDAYSRLIRRYRDEIILLLDGCDLNTLYSVAEAVKPGRMVIQIPYATIDKRVMEMEVNTIQRLANLDIDYIIELNIPKEFIPEENTMIALTSLFNNIFGEERVSYSLYPYLFDTRLEDLYNIFRKMSML